jgi:hypothetical protein
VWTRALLALGSVVLAAACARHEDVYPPDVVRNFLTACVPRADERICRCALDALQRRFSLEQFRAFEARMRAGDMPKEMLDAVTGCRR